ncbi:MAG: hypothetical protein ACK45B_06185 [Limisphaerales bacterium]
MRFERAHLLKPAESPGQELAFRLAPLVLQEVRGTNLPPLFTNVFFHFAAVELEGRSHVQVTYWWEYPTLEKASFPAKVAPPRRGPEPRPRRAAAQPAPLAAQGIRLTLDAQGIPALFEVLGATNETLTIYVNDSLETAARLEHGGPLPGRRLAIERDRGEAPNIEVPRVLEDPPAVMGPIVYLHADSRAVATVICRCMPAEARELAGQSFYTLVPADGSGNVAPATRLATVFPRWLPEDFSNPSDRLTRSLRLPGKF